MKTFELNPAALNWLGSAFEKKTKVSPFANLQPAEFTQDGLNALVQQGVVCEDQSMTPEAYAMLEVLANADKFASVHLAGGSGHVNRVTYWQGDKVVSLDNAGRVITLVPGNNIQGIEALIREITGSNRLVNSEFSGTFDARTALIFAGLFDLSRQAAIRLYSDGAKVATSFSAAEVKKFIDETNNARWLTSYIKTLKVPGGLNVTAANVETGLKGLVTSGIAAAAGNLYTLSGDAADLAARFLFIENTVRFTAGSENGAKVNLAEGLFLQAGVHDCMLVDLSSKGVEITALSSYAMVEAVKKLMTVPPPF